jgi:hypothetical protein
MKKTAALRLKPPLSKRIKICLLYDGFFSFAVVRQILIIRIFPKWCLLR